MLENKLYQIVDLLKVLAEAEKEVAALYQVCREKFPGDNDFWNNLINAELKHEKNLKKMLDILLKKADLFKMGRPLNIQGIKTFIYGIKENGRRVIEGELKNDKIYYIIKDIEMSIIENKLNEIVETNDIEYLQLANEIVMETQMHKMIIDRKIEEYKKTS